MPVAWPIRGEKTLIAGITGNVLQRQFLERPAALCMHEIAMRTVQRTADTFDEGVLDNQIPFVIECPYRIGTFLVDVDVEAINERDT